MLAVDVITDKLRDQSLEDAAKAGNSKIKFIHPGDGLKLSKNAEATIAGAGKKVWTVQLNSSSTADKHFKSPSKSPSKTLSSKEQRINTDSAAGILCPHRQLHHLCVFCENTPNTPPTPPKKRHCRTLITPIDGPAPSSWQPQGTQIWKPVTVIPSNTNGSSNTTFPTNFHHGGDYSAPQICTNTSGFISLAPQLSQFDAGMSHCDIFTPPESPVPRPSSASTCSVRYDGAFSPLGAPWLDSCSQSWNKYSAFQNRSLSVEDEISYTTTSGSTTSVPGCISSVPSSPHRSRIPRCKSQPSFIRERKYGLKRRRDYDRRPALDFRKMTETAYEQHVRPLASSHRNKERTASRFHQELESVMNLMPIASSPMDNDFPLKRIMDSRASPISEMDQCRSDSAEFLDGECLDSDKEAVKIINPDSDTCECSSDIEEDIFPLQEDIDLEQIENH